MRKNMHYPKKTLILQSQSVWVTENKIYYFFGHFGTYVLGSRQKQIV
jgi:hypothetical protein